MGVSLPASTPAVLPVAEPSVEHDEHIFRLCYVRRPEGIIAELGDGVDNYALGDRVAVGWFGGHCGECIPCRQGDFIHCVNLRVPS